MSRAEEKDVIVLELNEFNLDILKTACAQYTLPNIKHLIDTAHSSQYKTDDRYNSGYLEPWVQWVSIHSGVPSTKHKIKHLGDVPDLGYTQCWETLSDHNITTGVWGVMNGARRNKKNVLFFLPDPWTFSEDAYPPKVNQLLRLPRYLSKNYRNLKVTKILHLSWQLLKYLATSGTGWQLTKIVGRLFGSLLKRGPKHYVFISYFDWISTHLFARMKRKYRPRCSFLFLNSIAHIQHHHWKQGTEVITPEILFGLKVIDKILHTLKEQFPLDEMVVHNGLTQMNTNHEKPWILYRQKDSEKFFRALHLQPIQVEQHMTHDGHAFFKTQQDCEHAYQLLKSLKIKNQFLFHVEYNTEDNKKLFYRLDFTDAVSSHTTVTSESHHFKFLDYFDNIVTRTGRHIPMGNILSYQVKFNNHIYNHEFNQYLFHYLAPNTFDLKPTTSSALSKSLAAIKQSEALCIQ